MIVQLEDGRWSARCEGDDCGRIAEIPEGSLAFAKRYLRAGGWSTGPGLTKKDTYCPLHDAERAFADVAREVVEHMQSPEGQAETQEALRQAIHRGRQEHAYEYVDHPAHYGGADDPYEVIKVIEAWELNFNLGTLVRYVGRAGKKPGEDALRDLRKARWYLDREIKRLEGA